MIAWLETLPTVLAGIVVVAVFLITTLLMAYFAGALTSEEVRLAHNDRAGFILAVIGVIYAVLLAFVAIGVWERFQEAEVRSYEEAGALATLYRDAASFPDGAALQGRLRGYVRSVIEDEWPKMQRGGKTEISDERLDAVDDAVRALPVSGPRLQDVHAQMLAALNTAMEDRQTRLTIDSMGINGIMWMVLIVGAYLTVGFTFLFAFDRTIMQQLMIGGLALMIGLVLFLVLALDFPFRGGISVSPEAFTELLASWRAAQP